MTHFGRPNDQLENDVMARIGLSMPFGTGNEKHPHYPVDDVVQESRGKVLQRITIDHATGTIHFGPWLPDMQRTEEILDPQPH